MEITSCPFGTRREPTTRGTQTFSAGRKSSGVSAVPQFAQVGEKAFNTEGAEGTEEDGEFRGPRSGAQVFSALLCALRELCVEMFFSAFPAAEASAISPAAGAGVSVPHCGHTK
jgi:hypothetical protein